jgi:hypothetical protein
VTAHYHPAAHNHTQLTVTTARLRTDRTALVLRAGIAWQIVIGECMQCVLHSEPTGTCDRLRFVLWLSYIVAKLLTYLRTCLLKYLITNSLTNLPTYLPTHLFTCLFVCLLAYLITVLSYLLAYLLGITVHLQKLIGLQPVKKFHAFY